MNEIPGRVRLPRDSVVQRVRLFFFISAVCLLAFYVWPTPWAYDHADGRLVRILRITDRVDILTPHGWVMVADRRTPEQILQKYGLLTDSVPRRP